MKKLVLLLLSFVALNCYANINVDLYNAAYKGDMAAIKISLKKGANINAKVKRMKVTPLYAAVLADRQNIVEFLLEKGADPNAKDELGVTPFMMAVRRIDNYNMVIRLLEYGADVHARDNKGRTVFSNTLYSGNAIRNLLRKYGAVN